MNRRIQKLSAVIKVLLYRLHAIILSAMLPRNCITWRRSSAIPLYALQCASSLNSAIGASRMQPSDNGPDRRRTTHCDIGQRR